MKAAFGEVVETIVLTAIIFLLVRSAVQNFKVEGRSMEPTLHTGQYLLINKTAYLSLDANAVVNSLLGRSDEVTTSNPVFPFGPPDRGDIIVFRYPVDPNRDFIKRVIGLPGERVEIMQGQVYINGQPLHEPYVKAAPLYDFPEQVVPANQYFVLGDNRNSSSDSHVWGMVPIENIIGRALLCYWPPQEWGMLPSPSSTAAQSVY